MRLVIIHYHLRPGGVRRVIELATPHLIREFGGKIDQIALATGERADEKWDDTFRRALIRLPLRVFIHPAFKYLSEQRGRPATIRKNLRLALKRLLNGATLDNTLIWAHNLGVARNLLLSRELGNICASRDLRLVSHHHDWWFDNRWRRWREMGKYGFRTLNSAARAIFPAAASVRHLAINRADVSRLEKGLSKRAGWLPNLAERGNAPTTDKVRVAKHWLRQQLPGSPPIWLLPCRLLRRKNVAEALLLTRWLRPEAWLVTTGGVSSAQEHAYYTALESAARRRSWPLRLGVLKGDETHKPTIPELLAASEAVLLTSIQEGFGLPYLEAAAAQRPLIARMIPNVAPDLAEFGFHFPQRYNEILIEPALFDWSAECGRQGKLFAEWRRTLPRQAQAFAEAPALLAAGHPTKPVAFSRLTLKAQLEVLAHPARESWKRCAPLNPFLSVWRQRAATGRLRTTSWPQTADKWLSGAAYARRLHRIAFADVKRPLSPNAPIQVQNSFLRENVRADHLFPLLWE